MKGRNGKGSQSNGMEAAVKNKHSPGDKGKPTAEQCPGKDNGNWHNIRRVRKADGYRCSMRQGEVLQMWSARTLQARLSQTTQDKGRGATMTQLLLGPCSNKRENGLESRGGKRWGQAVNDSTDSAKNLVSSGMHSSPASQTHCTSVVVNTHLNILVHDFTTRNKTKEESKQAVGAAAPKTAQPAKCLASNSS